MILFYNKPGSTIFILYLTNNTIWRRCSTDMLYNAIQFMVQCCQVEKGLNLMTVESLSSELEYRKRWNMCQHRTMLPGWRNLPVFKGILFIKKKNVIQSGNFDITYYNCLSTILFRQADGNRSLSRNFIIFPGIKKWKSCYYYKVKTDQHFCLAIGFDTLEWISTQMLRDSEKLELYVKILHWVSLMFATNQSFLCLAL